jgi:hypothetical protein
MPAIEIGPMTQARSRWLGRALLGVAGLQVLLAARSVRGRSALIGLPVLAAVGALSVLLAWTGVTLAVMDWDAPADYPPAASGDSESSEDAPRD